jgi:hypothetical protein
VNRLIIVTLTFLGRRDDLFEPLERLSVDFHKIGAGWLTERAATKARFAERLRFWRAELLKVFAGKHVSASRLAQNYGIVLAGLELMLPPEKFAGFVDWVKVQCLEQEDVEARHSVIEEFIGELQYLHSTQEEKLKKMVRATSQYLTLWVGGIVRLIEDVRRSKPDFTTESLIRYFREEPYFHRVGAVSLHRNEGSYHCVVLFTEKLPPALKDLAMEFGKFGEGFEGNSVFGD